MISIILKTNQYSLFTTFKHLHCLIVQKNEINCSIQQQVGFVLVLKFKFEKFVSKQV
jgi:hypothetical protein